MKYSAKNRKSASKTTKYKNHVDEKINFGYTITKKINGKLRLFLVGKLFVIITNSVQANNI